MQNTDSKAHSFTFEILGDDGLQIISPREPVVVKEGNKRKLVVTIRAQNPLDSALEDKDLLQNIKLRAYAVDDESIQVERKTFFVYPSAKELRKER